MELLILYPECQGPGYMTPFRVTRATYMTPLRVNYMTPQGHTIDPLEYTANGCHNVPKKEGTKWQGGKWR